MMFTHNVRRQSISLKPKGRILHVEDDADNREFITLLLKGEGCEVIPTDDPVEALKIVRRIPFDLYIVDVRLPEMSGLELCRKLRQSDGNKPVLILSAAAYDGDKKRAFECGASAYLVKPVDTEYLVREVNCIISGNGFDCVLVLNRPWAEKSVMIRFGPP